MEVRDLRYFLLVAELGHLSRAAQRAGRTQPALSKCIRRLEERIGSRLFARNGRGLQLTAVGQALEERARTVCQMVDESLEELASVARGDLGTVRIATVPTAGDNLLPEAFKALTAKPSRVQFKVTIGMTDVLRKLLRNDEVDLVVGPLLESDRAEFGRARLALDHLVVAARRDHPVARGRTRIGDLAGYDWLLPSKSVASRQWLDQCFESRNLQAPLVKIESNSVRMLREVIAQTDMLTFTSRRDLRAHGEPDLCEICLPETTMEREMGILFPRDRPLSPAVSSVVSALVVSGQAQSASPAAGRRRPARKNSAAAVRATQ